MHFIEKYGMLAVKVRDGAVTGRVCARSDRAVAAGRCVSVVPASFLSRSPASFPLLLSLAVLLAADPVQVRAAPLVQGRQCHCHGPRGRGEYYRYASWPW